MCVYKIRIFGTQTKVKGKHCGKQLESGVPKNMPACAKTISDIKLHVQCTRTNSCRYIYCVYIIYIYHVFSVQHFDSMFLYTQYFYIK